MEGLIYITMDKCRRYNFGDYMFEERGGDAVTRMRKFWKMMMVIVLLILILIFILVLLILETTVRNKYDEQIALGNKYLAEQDYEQAELCFKRAINISDKAAEPYIKLANVYRETGDMEEAVSVVQEMNDTGQGMTEQQKKILESYVDEFQTAAKGLGEDIDENELAGSDDKVVEEVELANKEDDREEEAPEPNIIETNPTDEDEREVNSENSNENYIYNDNDGSGKEERKENQIDLKKIVQDTTGLSYIGDMGYEITAVSSGEQILCNSIGASGYLAACENDYDGDGGEEILVIALQSEEISAVKQDFFCMYMLKQDGENWKTQDTYAVGTESKGDTEKIHTVLRSNILPARVQFFVKESDEGADIIMEMTSKAGRFNGKASCGIQKYTYTGGSFFCSDQGVWIGDSSSNENSNSDVLRSLNTWGLSATKLDYGNEVMGQNISVTPLVRIDKVSLLEELSFSSWDRISPLENMGRVVFTDYSEVKAANDAAPGTIDLMDIPLGITAEDFHDTWKPCLEAAQATQIPPTGGGNDREAYLLMTEAFYTNVPLEVEFIFQNNKLVCIQFMNQLSDTESYEEKLDMGDDRFTDECIRSFAGQPEVFAYEGAMYSWHGTDERVDLIRRPGIVDFSRWDNTLRQEFSLSLGQ